MNYSDARAALVNWVCTQLTGPWSGDEPLRGRAPLERFPVGVLFPVGVPEEPESVADVYEEEMKPDDAESLGAIDQGQPTQAYPRYVPPSSVGFSFFIRGRDIQLRVECAAAKYCPVHRDDAGRFIPEEWTRVRLPDRDAEVAFFPRPPETHLQAERSKPKDVFGGLAQIDVLWRPHAGGWIVTVSLVNIQKAERNGSAQDSWDERNSKALFETRLSCFIDSGEVGDYPRVDRSLLSDEEQELELRYRHRHIYAIGHGAAVDWTIKDGRVFEILSAFVPAVAVPDVTAPVEGGDAEALGLQNLAGCVVADSGVFANLERFISGYANWIAQRRSEADGATLAPEDQPAATRIVGRMEEAVARMRQGLHLLRTDTVAARAFSIANLAMLEQMAQGDRCLGRPVDLAHYRWRPFQLAFLLAVIESAANMESAFRDTVDLIWFPTGGGKTEAYLGLIAFVIAYRRMRNSTSGGGTTVLMRYTLRLLTLQQYQRATRMICALELLRRERPELGPEPITVGLWVGEASSPNRYADAHALVQGAAQGDREPPQRLVISRCPWCGTPFRAPDNYESAEDRFHFRCTKPDCEFGSRYGGLLPCNVVDDALYAAPPTLLVATIDKFARLSWDDRPSAFFGLAHNQPPSLIVQDELHLIAGALGSVAGLYEAALDTAITARGIHPKYVASTATIRMAEKQVRRLYGRDVRVFPPPGLDCDDSYYARTVPIDVLHPGRLYVGYLTYALPRPEWMAPLCGALLAAPLVVFGANQRDRDALWDAWWTQVVYHGSLKGVGASHTSFTNQVRSWVGQLIQEARERNREAGHPDDTASDPYAPDVDTPQVRAANIAQLTSVATPEENSRTFARLELPRGDPLCLDAVLATNMISVGLDVARLALMVINGQPLTTAEYIQASSRVGRANIPGIVFTHYYRTQARSLSHYESFRPYHESFYRFVEPTSITPFTYQTRVRALHAALVIAIRHGGTGLGANEAAGQFDPDMPEVARTIDLLERRCRKADPGRGEQTKEHLERLIGEWRTEVKRCQIARRKLLYQAPGDETNSDRILYAHNDKVTGLWPTLHSMRNVENTTLLKYP